MKKFFLIPLLTLICSVMAWAVEVSDLQGLNDAVTAGGDITLAADINAGTNPTITIASGKTVTLDLNGHRLYASVSTSGGLIKNNGNLTIIDSQNGHNGIIENTYGSAGGFTRFIENYGTMWVKKGQIIAQSKMCINTEKNSTLIVGTEGGSNDDVLIESKSNTSGNPTYYDGNANAAVAITTRLNSHLTVYCGTFKSKSHYTIFAADKGDLKIYNGVFVRGVNAPGWFGVAGEFISSNLQIFGGTYPEDPSEYVAQDYYVEHSDDVYEVLPMPDPLLYTVYSVADMESALNNATYIQAVYMTLGANIVLDKKIVLPHGSQLTIPAGRAFAVQEGGLFVNEGRTVNEGTISITGSGFFSKPASVEGAGSIVLSGYTINESAGVVNYTVSNAMQLQYLAYLVLQDAYADKTWDISLTTDINLPTDAEFEPIQNIVGTFDGKKYAINHFRSENSLLKKFQGRICNLTFNDARVLDGGAILCYTVDHNTIFENIVLNGSFESETSSFGAFISTVENISTAGREYGMRDADDFLWLVNCINNVNASSTKGLIMGGLIGTISGANGKIGFYNCENNGNLSASANTGACVGHGRGSGSVQLEFISFKNTGTISGTGVTVCDVAKVLGQGDNSYITCTYIDPTQYTAVYVYDEDEGKYKYVAKEAGVIDNTNSGSTTDWATNTTWTDEGNVNNVVPTEADNVTVSKAVEVNNGTDAEANKVKVAENQTLTIKEGGSLTIGENGLTIAADATVKVEKGATLVIGGTTVGGDKGGITIQGEGEHAGKLIIEATQADGTGVVLVDPEAPLASTRVEAEVELIPDAYKVSTDVYKHRYIGIPLYFESAEEFTSANWQRAAIQGSESVVTHAKIWNNGWQDVASISEFVPFKGYALTNESTHGVKYTFKGKLVGNGDGTMNFAYGFNLFANSYTAPINIQTLLNGLDNNVKATIYMFKDDKLQTVSKADFAGFRTPKFTVIPSMQAFFVLMDDGTSATEYIDYADAVFNNSLANGPLYAPKHQETPAFNRVRINIAAENGASDELYLIEAVDYTSDFENGFDEAKFMNNGLNIYATTAYGRQATQISNDLNGTFVGVTGNGTYTLTFDELEGDEYQIRDLQTNAVVTMSEANNYTFTVNGTNDARFVVESIAKMPTAFDNVDAAKMFISNNTLYISENNSNANIMIYAANGQLVLDEVAQPTVSLNGLASGVYTVRVANQTLKFVK